MYTGGQRVPLAHPKFPLKLMIAGGENSSTIFIRIPFSDLGGLGA